MQDLDSIQDFETTKRLVDPNILQELSDTWDSGLDEATIN